LNLLLKRVMASSRAWVETCFRAVANTALLLLLFTSPLAVLFGDATGGAVAFTVDAAAAGGDGVEVEGAVAAVGGAGGARAAAREAANALRSRLGGSYSSNNTQYEKNEHCFVLMRASNVVRIL
jgi:hypothetical protein